MSSINSSAYVDYPGYIYAVLVAQGGIMGFVKKGSIASLLAGVGSGAAIAYGAYLNTANPREVRLSLVVCAALILMMGPKFLRTGKFMPAGMVTLASAIMAVRYALRIL
ncbi:hypothetical protein NliqN6_3049 [Naganishia liquefaciens]|uniref:Transmembrane protein 14C n=1 Tax=Naganishia liquefaciens TaxID=104408 RepID=A0A8H3TT26_9TREE|nr:hypothetical protein NliqN6_3049 [Naganishia liquefaciens]